MPTHTLSRCDCPVMSAGGDFVSVSPDSIVVGVGRGLSWSCSFHLNNLRQTLLFSLFCQSSVKLSITFLLMLFGPLRHSRLRGWPVESMSL